MITAITTLLILIGLAYGLIAVMRRNILIAILVAVVSPLLLFFWMMAECIDYAVRSFSNRDRPS